MNRKKPGKNFIEVDAAEDVAEVGKKRRMVLSGSKEACQERGVVYLSNIPDGFYENEMRKFFSQFGAVTNIRLGRSRKTGRSRGYAFLEFRYREVAEIVAQTMNNYLMFERLMKCKVVPQERVRTSIFKGKVVAQRPPGFRARQLAKRQANAKRDERQELKRRRHQFGSLQRTAAKLRAAGIEFHVDMPDVEREKQERRERLKEGVKTPVMAVDDSDLDITLKTPPNVRKIKSRSNSVANSTNVTPSSRKSRSSGRVVKKGKAEGQTPSLAEAKVPRMIFQKGLRVTPKHETPKSKKVISAPAK